jgi:hypothetical protein
MSTTIATNTNTHTQIFGTTPYTKAPFINQNSS